MGVHDEMRQRLLSSVVVTLENMAFAQVEEMKIYWARLKFLTPVKGELLVVLPESLACELAEGIYGMSKDDESPGAAVLSDVSAELSNMIAGQLMELLLPPDKSFSLSIPEAGTCEWMVFPARMDVFYFTVNGSCLSVGVSKGLLKL